MFRALYDIENKIIRLPLDNYKEFTMLAAGTDIKNFERLPNTEIDGVKPIYILV